MVLKNSLTASQLVNEWSGTSAQIRCNVDLYDVANADNIPTMSDINRVFGNSTSISIIVNHLQSVFRYAGVELPSDQLGETALSMLSSYYYLNVAELCLYFSQLKNGSRGQFVWGSKINNQAIMVALADFCIDRKRAIERREIERSRIEKENGYSRNETLCRDIVLGAKSIKDKREKAIANFDLFLEFFPYIPDKYKPETWWKAWGGDKDALMQIYGENIHLIEKAQDDVGRFLCEYNMAKNKQNERI